MIIQVKAEFLCSAQNEWKKIVLFLGNQLKKLLLNVQTCVVCKKLFCCFVNDSRSFKEALTVPDLSIKNY
jgi:hypothetical protein